MQMFGNIFSKEREKWVVGGLLLLIVLTALNVILSQSETTTTTPTDASDKTAVLMLTTADNSVAVGDQFMVAVKLDPNKSAVDAVDTVLNYDSSVIKAVGVEAGSMFGTYPVQSTGSNSAQLSAFSLPSADGSSQAVKTAGVLGTITFEAVGTGSTSIAFDEEKTIVLSAVRDVLQSADGLTIAVR